jgi:flagellin-like protein
MDDIIRLVKTRVFLNSLHRRGVAPVIATLLLVAIAVVGGSLIFVFAQGFFAESQVSGSPTIEFIKIVGYDARDAAQVKAHDGIDIETKNKDCCGISDGIKNADERITIYLQNNSVDQVFISEIRISGVVYDFTTYTTIPPPFGVGGWDQANVKPQPGEYVILTGHDGRVGGDLLEFPAPTIQPGEIITVLVDLDKSYNTSRDAQFKLTTTNGAVFVSTIIMGQDSG